MTTPSSTTTAPVKKLGRGESRCFRCRKVFMSKEGEWCRWIPQNGGVNNGTEVHLCRKCNNETQGTSERGGNR